MIAFTTLETAVATNIKIGANAVDMAHFNIPEALNYAQRFIVTNLPTHHLSEAIMTAVAPLTAAIDTYEWPSNFVRMVWLRIRYADADKFLPARLLTGVTEDLDTEEEQPNPLFPAVQVDTERGFYIKPKPATDVTAGIRLRFVYHLPELSSTQNCMLDSKWRNLLVLKATSFAFMVEGRNQDQADRYEKLAQLEIANWMPKAEII